MAKTRVQATSQRRATSPDVKRATAATTGLAGRSVSFRDGFGDAVHRRAFGAMADKRGFPGLLSGIVAWRARYIAPAAAITFTRTPSQIVFAAPSAGRSTKPVATAPSAAPAAFEAYNTRSARPPRGSAWHPRIAIGYVAPMRAAGIDTSARQKATLATAKIADGPSPYKPPSIGPAARRTSGRAMAQAATSSSRHA